MKSCNRTRPTCTLINKVPPSSASMRKRVCVDSTIPWPLLLLLMLAMFNTTTSTLLSPISCTYANSSCITCPSACLQGRLFPLFPSQCDPDSLSLDYRNVSHPDRAPPSVQLPSDISTDGFNVPANLFPPSSSLSNGYTITTYFMDSGATEGILLLVNNVLNVSYANQEVLLQLNETFLSLSLAGVVGTWRAVSITLTPDLVSLNSSVGYNMSSLLPQEFISSISSIIIGRTFVDILQDFIIYDEPLGNSMVPQMAKFLPQCYCSGNNSLTMNGKCISNTSGYISERFSESSGMPTDFAADTSEQTAWTSGSDDTPVTFVVGLSSTIILSKIFIVLSSSSYQTAVLQFLGDIDSSVWMDLQLYARNCSDSFGLEPEGPLVDSKAVNCLPVPNTGLLAFYLEGSAMSMRTINSTDILYFSASQVRLILNGFSGVSTNYSIQSFEICSQVCLDLSPSCACLSRTTSTISESFPSTSSQSDASSNIDIDSLSISQISTAPSTSSQNEPNLSATSTVVDIPTNTMTEEPSIGESTSTLVDAPSTSSQGEAELLPTSTLIDAPSTSSQGEVNPYSTSTVAAASSISSQSEADLSSTSTMDVPLYTSSQDEVEPFPTSTIAATPSTSSQSEAEPSSTSTMAATPSTASQGVVDLSSTSTMAVASSTSSQGETEPSPIGTMAVTPSISSQNEAEPSPTSTMAALSSTSWQDESEPFSTSIMTTVHSTSSRDEIESLPTSTLASSSSTSSQDEVEPSPTSTMAVAPSISSQSESEPSPTSTMAATPSTGSQGVVVDLSPTNTMAAASSTSSQDEVEPSPTSTMAAASLISSQSEADLSSTSTMDVPLSTSSQDEVEPFLTSTMAAAPLTSSQSEADLSSTSTMDVPLSTSSQDEVEPSPTSTIAATSSTSSQDEVEPSPTSTMAVAPSISSQSETDPSPMSTMAATPSTGSQGVVDLSPTNTMATASSTSSQDEVEPSPTSTMAAAPLTSSQSEADLSSTSTMDVPLSTSSQDEVEPFPTSTMAAAPLTSSQSEADLSSTSTMDVPLSTSSQDEVEPSPTSTIAATSSTSSQDEVEPSPTSTMAVAPSISSQSETDPSPMSTMAATPSTGSQGVVDLSPTNTMATASSTSSQDEVEPSPTSTMAAAPLTSSQSEADLSSTSTMDVPLSTSSQDEVEPFPTSTIAATPSTSSQDEVEPSPRSTMAASPLTSSQSEADLSSTSTMDVPLSTSSQDEVESFPTSTIAAIPSTISQDEVEPSPASTMAAAPLTSSQSEADLSSTSTIAATPSTSSQDEVEPSPRSTMAAAPLNSSQSEADLSSTSTMDVPLSTSSQDEVEPFPTSTIAATPSTSSQDEVEPSPTSTIAATSSTSSQDEVEPSPTSTMAVAPSISSQSETDPSPMSTMAATPSTGSQGVVDLSPTNTMATASSTSSQDEVEPSPTSTMAAAPLTSSQSEADLSSTSTMDVPLSTSSQDEVEPSSTSTIAATPSTSSQDEVEPSPTSTMAVVPSISSQSETDPSPMSTMAATPSTGSQGVVDLSPTNTMATASSTSSQDEVEPSPTSTMAAAPLTSSQSEADLSSTSTMDVPLSTSSQDEVEPFPTSTIAATHSTSSQSEAEPSSTGTMAATPSTASQDVVDLSSTSTMAAASSTSSQDETKPSPIAVTPSISSAEPFPTSTMAAAPLTSSQSEADLSSTSTMDVPLSTSSQDEVEPFPTSTIAATPSTSSQDEVEPSPTSTMAAAPLTSSQSEADLSSTSTMDVPLSTSSQDEVEPFPTSTIAATPSTSSQDEVEPSPRSTMAASPLTSSQSEADLSSTSTMDVPLSTSSQDEVESFPTSTIAAIPSTISQDEVEPSPASTMAAAPLTSSQSEADLSSTSTIAATPSTSSQDEVEPSPRSTMAAAPLNSSQSEADLSSTSTMDVPLSTSSQDEVEPFPTSTIAATPSTSSQDEVEPSPTSTIAATSSTSSQDEVEPSPTSTMAVAPSISNQSETDPSSMSTMAATPSTGSQGVVDLSPTNTMATASSTSSQDEVEPSPTSTMAAAPLTSSQSEADLSSTSTMDVPLSTSSQDEVEPSSTSTIAATPSTSSQDEVEPSPTSTMAVVPSISSQSETDPSPMSTMAATPSTGSQGVVDLSPTNTMATASSTSSQDEVEPSPTSTMAAAPLTSSQSEADLSSTSTMDVPLSTSSQDEVEPFPISTMAAAPLTSSQSEADLSSTSTMDVPLSTSSQDEVEPSPTSTMAAAPLTSSQSEADLSSTSTMDVPLSTSSQDEVEPFPTSTIAATHSTSSQSEAEPSSTGTMAATPSTASQDVVDLSSTSTMAAASSTSSQDETKPSPIAVTPSISSAEPFPTSTMAAAPLTSSQSEADLSSTSTMDVPLSTSSQDEVEPFPTSTIAATPSTSSQDEVEPSPTSTMAAAPLTSSQSEADLSSTSTMDVPLSTSSQDEVEPFPTNTIAATPSSSSQDEVEPSPTSTMAAAPLTSSQSEADLSSTSTMDVPLSTSSQDEVEPFPTSTIAATPSTSSQDEVEPSPASTMAAAPLTSSQSEADLSSTSTMDVPLSTSSQDEVEPFPTNTIAATPSSSSQDEVEPSPTSTMAAAPLTSSQSEADLSSTSTMDVPLSTTSSQDEVEPFPTSTIAAAPATSSQDEVEPSPTSTMTAVSPSSIPRNTIAISDVFTPSEGSATTEPTSSDITTPTEISNELLSNELFSTPFFSASSEQFTETIPSLVPATYVEVSIAMPTPTLILASPIEATDSISGSIKVTLSDDNFTPEPTPGPILITGSTEVSDSLLTSNFFQSSVFLKSDEASTEVNSVSEADLSSAFAVSIDISLTIQPTPISVSVSSLQVSTSENSFSIDLFLSSSIESKTRVSFVNFLSSVDTSSGSDDGSGDSFTISESALSIEVTSTESFPTSPTSNLEEESFLTSIEPTQSSSLVFSSLMMTDSIFSSSSIESEESPSFINFLSSVDILSSPLPSSGDGSGESFTIGESALSVEVTSTESFPTSPTSNLEEESFLTSIEPTQSSSLVFSSLMMTDSIFPSSSIESEESPSFINFLSSVDILSSPLPSSGDGSGKSFTIGESALSIEVISTESFPIALTSNLEEERFLTSIEPTQSLSFVFSSLMMTSSTISSSSFESEGSPSFVDFLSTADILSSPSSGSGDGSGDSFTISESAFSIEVTSTVSLTSNLEEESLFTSSKPTRSSSFVFSSLMMTDSIFPSSSIESEESPSFINFLSSVDILSSSLPSSGDRSGESFTISESTLSIEVTSTESFSIPTSNLEEESFLPSIEPTQSSSFVFSSLTMTDSIFPSSSIESEESPSFIDVLSSVDILSSPLPGSGNGSGDFFTISESALSIEVTSTESFPVALTSNLEEESFLTSIERTQSSSLVFSSLMMTDSIFPSSSFGSEESPSFVDFLSSVDILSSPSSGSGDGSDDSFTISESALSIEITSTESFTISPTSNLEEESFLSSIEPTQSSSFVFSSLIMTASIFPSSSIESEDSTSFVVFLSSVDILSSFLPGSGDGSGDSFTISESAFLIEVTSTVSLTSNLEEESLFTSSESTQSVSFVFSSLTMTDSIFPSSSIENEESPSFIDVLSSVDILSSSPGSGDGSDDSFTISESALSIEVTSTESFTISPTSNLEEESFLTSIEPTQSSSFVFSSLMMTDSIFPSSSFESEESPSFVVFLSSVDILSSFLPGSGDGSGDSFTISESAFSIEVTSTVSLTSNLEEESLFTSSEPTRSSSFVFSSLMMTDSIFPSSSIESEESPSFINFLSSVDILSSSLPSSGDRSGESFTISESTLSIEVTSTESFSIPTSNLEEESFLPSIEPTQSSSFVFSSLTMTDSIFPSSSIESEESPSFIDVLSSVDILSSPSSGSGDGSGDFFTISESALSIEVTSTESFPVALTSNLEEESFLTSIERTQSSSLVFSSLMMTDSIFPSSSFGSEESPSFVDFLSSVDILSSPSSGSGDGSDDSFTISESALSIEITSTESFTISPTSNLEEESFLSSIEPTQSSSFVFSSLIMTASIFPSSSIESEDSTSFVVFLSSVDILSSFLPGSGDGSGDSFTISESAFLIEVTSTVSLTSNLEEESLFTSSESTQSISFVFSSLTMTDSIFPSSSIENEESPSFIDVLSSVDILSSPSPGSGDGSDDSFTISESALSIEVTSTESFTISPTSNLEEESFLTSIEPTQSSSFVLMMTDSIFPSSSFESEESPSFVDFLSSVDILSSFLPGSGDGSGDSFTVSESALSIEVTSTESFTIFPTSNLEEESFLTSIEPTQSSSFVFSSLMMTDSIFPSSSFESEESPSFVVFLSSVDILSSFLPGSGDGSGDSFTISESAFLIEVTSTVSLTSNLEEESLFTSSESTQSVSFVFSSLTMTDSIFPSSSIENEESPSFIDVLSSVDILSSPSPGSGDGSGDSFTISESALSIEVTSTESFTISPTSNLEEESFLTSIEPTQSSSFVLMTDSIFPSSSFESEESPSFVDFLLSSFLPGSGDGSGDSFTVSESALSIEVTSTESFTISPTSNLEEESFLTSIEPTQSSSFVFSSLMMTDSIFPSSSIESEESPSFIDFLSSVDILSSPSSGSGDVSGDFFTISESALSIEVTSTESFPVALTSNLEEESFLTSIERTQSSSLVFSSLMMTDSIFPSSSFESEESPSFVDFLSSVDILSSPSSGSGDGSDDSFTISESALSIEITSTESFTISPTSNLEEESFLSSIEPTQSSSFDFSSLMMTASIFPSSSIESEDRTSFFDFLSSVDILSSLSSGSGDGSGDSFTISESALSIEVTFTESFTISPTSNLEEESFLTSIEPTQSSSLVFSSLMMTDSIFPSSSFESEESPSFVDFLSSVDILSSPSSGSGDGSDDSFTISESALSIEITSTESFTISPTSNLEEESFLSSIEPTQSSSFVFSSLMMTDSIFPSSSFESEESPSSVDFLSSVDILSSFLPGSGDGSGDSFTISESALSIEVTSTVSLTSNLEEESLFTSSEPTQSSSFVFSSLTMTDSIFPSSSIESEESPSFIDVLSSVDILSSPLPGSGDGSGDSFTISESAFLIEVTSTVSLTSNLEEESLFTSSESTQSVSFVFSSLTMTDSIFPSSSIENEESPSFIDVLSSVDILSSPSPGSGDGSDDSFTISESALSIEVTSTESFTISPTSNLEEESFLTSIEPTQSSSFVLMTDSIFPSSSFESEESPSFVDFLSSVDILSSFLPGSGDGSGDSFTISESALSIEVTSTVSLTSNLEEESLLTSIEPTQSLSFDFSSLMMTDSIFPSSSIESEESPSFIDFLSSVDILSSPSSGSGDVSGDFFTISESAFLIEVTSTVSLTSNLEEESLFTSSESTQSVSFVFSSLTMTDSIFPSSSIENEESPSFIDVLSSVDILSSPSPGSGDGSDDSFTISESALSIEVTSTESFTISRTSNLEEESLLTSIEPTQSSSFVLMTDSIFPSSSFESEESPSFVDFLSSVDILSSFLPGSGDGSGDSFTISESALSIEVTSTESFTISPTSNLEEENLLTSIEPTQSSSFVLMTDSIFPSSSFESEESPSFVDFLSSADILSSSSPGSGDGSGDSALSIEVTSIESFPISSTFILEEESFVISIELTQSSSFVIGLASSLITYSTNIQTLFDLITLVDSTAIVVSPTPSEFLEEGGGTSIQSLETLLPDFSVEIDSTPQIGTTFSSENLEDKVGMTEIFPSETIEIFPSETVTTASQLILSFSEFETFSTSVLNVEPTTSSDMLIFTSESVSRSLNSSNSSTVFFSELGITETISSYFIPTSLEPTTPVITKVPLPSPTPNPLVCDPPKESQPLFPLDVRMVGYGLINQVVGNGIINQSIPAANSVDFLTTVSAIGRPDIIQNTGEIKIILQDDSLTSATFRVVNTSSLHIIGRLSKSEIYINSQPLTAVVQVRDASFNINLEVNVIIALHNVSGKPLYYNCLKANLPPGFCTASFTDIPRDWFLLHSDSNVSVTASIAGTSTTEYLGYLNLKATLPEVPPLFNTIYAIVPTCSMVTCKEIDIEVYARYDTLVFGFSLDCMLGGSAVIKDARASFEWSLISDIFNSSNKRIAVTGFRNYNKSNVRSTQMEPDHLFNLTIGITEDGVNASMGNLLKCDAVKLLFTNKTELQGKFSVAVICQERACTGLEFPALLNIFVYAEQMELLNVMPHTVLNNTEIPLHLEGFYSNGSLYPITQNAICSSLDMDIIQVYSNCSAVFFNGDENSGSGRVGIMISYENINTSIFFKVWYVNNVELEVEDRELNVISTVCSGMRYQSTTVLITAFAVTDTGSSPHTISLTDYLLAYLVTSNETVAAVSDGEIIGISEGTVNISLQHMESASVQVHISDIPVCVYSLDVVSFSDVDLEVTDRLDDQLRHIVTLSLLQNFQYIHSTLTLVGVAIFSDGYRMRINEAEEIHFQIDHPEVVSEKGLGRFVIQTPLPLINITTVWQFAGCEIIRSELTLTTNVSMLPELQIKLSRSVLTYPDDPATSFGIPSGLHLEANLIYSNNYTVQIPINDSSLKIVFPEGLLLVQDLVTVSRNITISQGAKIRANYSTGTDVLCGSAAVTIKHATDLILTAYVSNPDNTVTELKQVGESGVYQEAQLLGLLAFNDGTREDVTLNSSFRALNPTDLISVVSRRLEKDHVIVIEALYASSHDLVLQGMLQLGNNTNDIIGNLSITVTNKSVQVLSIDEIILTQSHNINEVYIDCTVSLDDGTRLNKTFQEGIPLYPSLINFTTDDTNQLFIQLNQNGMGNFHMINNSFSIINLTAVSNGTKNTVSFYSNLRAGLGELDLGNDSIENRSLQDVEVNKTFKVPVILNSNVTAVGVYKLSVLYEPANALVLDRVIQGENWLNGSLVYIGNGSSVTVSGLLITGARSSSIRLVDIFFTACKSCDDIVKFTASISYLSEANITLQDIPTFTSTASEIQMRIVPVQNRKRRSTDVEPTGRRRRQRDTNCMMVYPTGDYNQDCLVDLRDLYLLQVYVAAATFNFSTATGSLVRGTVDVISQISAIERSSLDINFIVDDINYQLYFDPSLQCIQQINGVVKSSSATVNNANIHLLLAFTSNDPTFLSNFSSYNLTGALLVDPSRGILDAQLTEINGSMTFQISGNAFLTEDFELLVITVVDTGEPSSNYIDLADSYYSNIAVTLNISNVDNRCTPVTTQIHTTVMSTTMISSARETTTMTTDATTVMTTKEETAVTTAKAATPLMNTKETTKDTTAAVDIERTTNEEIVATSGESNDASSNLIGIVFGIITPVVIILALLIVATVFLIRRQHKQKDTYRPSASEGRDRTSQNFWCGEEQQIEMSPIDIVPLHENMLIRGSEASMDLVPNHRIYHSERTESTIFSNSTNMNFVHPPIKDTATSPSRRHNHPSYEDRTVDLPLSHSLASVTCKSQVNDTSYEMEDEEMLYFKFNDDAMQPYMSLGLTPLSQLSPDHETPSNASDSYFFPSMPPPVTSISSMFSIRSNPSPGIPMSSHYNTSGGEVMVTEANPVYDHSTSRKSRKTKNEVPIHSQSYTTKLEPVPELSSSDDSHSRHPAIGSNVSSNSTDNYSCGFLFPSADVSDYKVHTHLQRKTGKRLKSGTRRKSEDHPNVQHETVLKNHSFLDSAEANLGHEDSALKSSYSPRQEGKVRQQMRERAHLLNKAPRTARLPHDYGSTRQQELDQEMVSAHNVAQQETPSYKPQKHKETRFGGEPGPKIVMETSHQFSVL